MPYIRFKLFGHRVVFYNRKITEVVGVNSTTKDGFHIPMIDTDKCTLEALVLEIRKLQRIYSLGDATICSTGRRNSFHVYIWSKMTWRDAIQVVASCQLGDLKHLQFSLRRGNFTLRISDKNGREVKPMTEVESRFENNCSYEDLESFTSYETASKIGKIE